MIENGPAAYSLDASASIDVTALKVPSARSQIWLPGFSEDVIEEEYC